MGIAGEGENGIAKYILRFEKVRNGSEKREAGGMRGVLRNEDKDEEDAILIYEDDWTPPSSPVRRNNVTRPGNIEDCRCPRRNIAP